MDEIQKFLERRKQILNCDGIISPKHLMLTAIDIIIYKSTLLTNIFSKFSKVICFFDA